jgi:chromosomal replication initiation ATPase DnaA
MYDERVLGDGQFVEAVLEKAEPRRMKGTMSKPESEQRFAAIREEICKRLKVGVDSLSSGSRARQVVRARAMVAYVAGRYLGWSGRRLSEKLGISPARVSMGIMKGEREIEELGWDLNSLFE